ncbi:transketolase [Sulfitobacter mediterraneus]|uniref:transketolase n=1 Tax=Sulfitobacter mediterraneus TaxID=83219 RepID=UPI001932FA36|nr:1-deoxy-D-xylulose-5-phosphate synthase N-terminal domain-containing protein [Sulfitobacter mediterraneus]MBM1634518.1 transketolase [Sulfitobacter mediterraneus]MBM1642335.1 transketolase [Sulfitobacter mediterraneus]MBM1646384.1 transketolase [Sulfitobacter mediterraneus]MBM1650430.1 transketolase [Sulfitobacter mediterraneus]MBM1654452.1 transketolase [Sulfitobacter mediterraneus]
MKPNAPSTAELALTAARIRRMVIEMCRQPKQGYAGQGLELADIMTVVFHDIKRPQDRFLLSTGHAAIALYAALWSVGEYEQEELMTYGFDGTEIEESPLDDLKGFEMTGGSLGQGPSQAAGLALGLRMQGSNARVICEVSDGELQEGAAWEGFMFAAARGLSNLVFVINDNGEQADGATAEVLDIGPLAPKFEAFGIKAIDVDGHDLTALRTAFRDAETAVGPVALICKTIPGKGIKTFDQFARVHYVRTTEEIWQAAADELDAQITELEGVPA